MARLGNAVYALDREIREEGERIDKTYLEIEEYRGRFVGRNGLPLNLGLWGVWGKKKT